jgi:hypothetical protein
MWVSYYVGDLFKFSIGIRQRRKCIFFSKLYQARKKTKIRGGKKKDWLNTSFTTFCKAMAPTTQKKMNALAP